MIHFAKTTNKSLFFITAILIFSSCSYKKKISAENIQVLPYYSSNMVLQKGMPVKIGGKCSSNGVLAVKIENVLKYATANAVGEWEVTFPAVDYAGAFSISIEGVDETIELNNVVVGQIWAIVGDSWLNDSLNNFSDKVSIGIQNNKVRYFQPELNFTPNSELNGEWKSLRREQINKYEHFCQLLGEEINQTQDDVIGLINLTWPGVKLSDYQADVIEGADTIWANYFEQQQNYRSIADSSFRGIEKGVLDRRSEDWDWNETEFPIIAYQRWFLKNRILWFRKKVYIPEKSIDSDFIVDFGTIRGQFDFYFNGIHLNSFKGEIRDYKLTIPDSLVKVWTNLITVRMVTGDSLSGFYSATPEITNVNSTFRRELSEEWLYRTYYEQRLPNVTKSDNLIVPIKSNLLDKLNNIDVEGVIIAGGYHFYAKEGAGNSSSVKALQDIEAKINAKHKYLFLISKPEAVDSIVNRRLYNALRNEQLEMAAKSGYRVINTLDIPTGINLELYYNSLISRFTNLHFE